ncbi:retrovirus-related Pol polyprotein from transposon 17.6 [Trichonephila clavipes]|nr:retrovirus-related Pol polyprotein from transposon 17.6 [Trichonephila clavipes]
MAELLQGCEKFTLPYVDDVGIFSQNWNDHISHIDKEKLSTNPIIYTPDFKRQLILQTDASDTGIGIVLAQRNDRGEEHPVQYLSKKFSDAEKVYCTTEKESAAIV